MDNKDCPICGFDCLKEDQYYRELTPDISECYGEIEHTLVYLNKEKRNETE